jgi:hypothetical protein
VKVTRDLIRAGQLLKIEVLDHLVMGSTKHASFRKLGYLHSLSTYEHQRQRFSFGDAIYILSRKKALIDGFQVDV